MTWLLVASGVVVGLVVLSVVVGSLLPRNHVAKVRARYRQPPEAVFATIADFSAWPSWNPHVRSMERLPDRDGHAVWQLTDASGKLPTALEELTPPSGDRPGKLVTRIADPTLPFAGTWTWEISSDGDGAVVTITEAGEIKNPVFRLMSKLFFDPHRTAERYLTALGNEHGQAVTPERVSEGG